MNKPIRVLQIVNQMNRGGMESRLMDLYRNMDHSKVQFDFYTFRKNPGEFDKEIESLGGRIFYNENLSIKNLRRNLKDLQKFLLAQGNYSIVHCHMNQWCGLLLMSAKKAAVPVRIAHSRTSLNKTSLKNYVKNVIKLPVNVMATHKFAVSKLAGEWLFGKRAAASGEVEVWPNAIECDKFAFSMDTRSRIRKELGIADEFTLIHVGNLRVEKNHEYIIKVFSKLKKYIPNAKLILVGKDNRNGYIHDISKDANVFDDILFLGSRTNVCELLQAGDVFVFPSHYEGFPGAVLEAEASGLFCVISKNITEEVCIGNLVERISITEDCIDSWVNTILNKPHIDRDTAYKIVSNNGYDIKTTAEKLENFYLNINM